MSSIISALFVLVRSRSGKKKESSFPLSFYVFNKKKEIDMNLDLLVFFVIFKINDFVLDFD